jgi:hypothetical protein
MQKKYFKFLVLIALIVLVYAIGNYFPIEILKPDYPETDVLNKSEYYRFIVSIISAFITFCAVLVALFKDDLREYWKRPRLILSEPSQITIEDLNDYETESTNRALIANRYISRIEIKNSGNIPSINTELFLEKLEFKSKESTIIQQIECYGKPLQWNGSESTAMVLPVGAKKLIDIVNITVPEKISKPDSQIEKNPSKIIIGGIPNHKEKNKGTWYATFGLYSQNHSLVSFKVEIEWTGVWTSRLTEFKSQYQIKIV